MTGSATKQSSSHRRSGGDIFFQLSVFSGIAGKVRRRSGGDADQVDCIEALAVQITLKLR